MANIQFAVSAGIVTILTIQPTKKETLQTASSRFYAFITALAIAIFSFEIFGYTLNAYIIYLVIFIIICQFFKW